MRGSDERSGEHGAVGWQWPHHLRIERLHRRASSRPVRSRGEIDWTGDDGRFPVRSRIARVTQ
jgi:hypothetical protein